MLWPSLFRHNAVLTASEKGKGRNGIGRRNQGKETEQAIKMGKDEKAPKPAGSTITSPGLDPDKDPTPSIFFCGFVRCQGLIEKIVAVRPPAKPQVNRPGNQTLKPPGVRPNQPRVHKPADGPRNRDNKLASHDQGRMADSRAATLQLPISNIAIKQDGLGAPQHGLDAPQQEEVSTTPRQQMVPPAPRQRESPVPQQRRKRKSRSMCGSSYYDLSLMTGNKQDAAALKIGTPPARRFAL